MGISSSSLISDGKGLHEIDAAFNLKVKALPDGVEFSSIPQIEYRHNTPVYHIVQTWTNLYFDETTQKYLTPVGGWTLWKTVHRWIECVALRTHFWLVMALAYYAYVERYVN